MRLVLFLGLALAASSLVASGEQQRILRRVIKSTPTASNLGRVRAVTVRSPGPVEKGTVSEISAKEAAQFGKRAANETSSPTVQQQPQPQSQQAIKTKPVGSPSATAAAAASSTTTTTTSTAATPTTPSAPATSTSTTQTPVSERQPPKASERQQVAQNEVELLSSAPSSWQMMTAVEAPAAALIAAGTRAALVSSSDLSPSSSEDSLSSSSSSSSSSYAPQGDFLRASSGKTSYSQSGEAFSRLRQQSVSKTRQQTQQQQSFFYPQQQQQQQLRIQQGKTSNYQATKTHWYQPSTTSTTPRPAPIVQEQQYEQQNEQYVEQQQVESAAPPGQAEPFAFDFNTQDTSGNGQYRKEESDNNGVVRGSYGFRDASGMYRHVEYVADANGFRANIKSNEPGLIAPEGDSQPASIRLSAAQAPVQQQSQRFVSNNNNDNSGEWQAASSSSNERADLALAPPDFESSHKPERVRVARHFRN